jgi:hypothetical protein
MKESVVIQEIKNMKNASTFLLISSPNSLSKKQDLISSWKSFPLSKNKAKIKKINSLKYLESSSNMKALSKR